MVNKQLKNGWALTRPDHVAVNFNIYSVGAGGAGTALIGRTGAVRRLFGIMSWASDCNAPVLSSGQQYQAKTSVYLLSGTGGGRRIDIQCRNEQSKYTGQQYKDRIKILLKMKYFLTPDQSIQWEDGRVFNGKFIIKLSQVGDTMPVCQYKIHSMFCMSNPVNF